MQFCYVLTFAMAGNWECEMERILSLFLTVAITSSSYPHTGNLPPERLERKCGQLSSLAVPLVELVPASELESAHLLFRPFAIRNLGPWHVNWRSTQLACNNL